MEPPTHTTATTNTRALKAATASSDPRSSTDAAAATAQKQSKPLACTACRARKLGCNRVHPCHNCLRSGAECVFPSRRRVQRPRKTKNSELLQRLSRLESIVGKVGIESLDAVDQQDDAAAAGGAGVAAGGAGGESSRRGGRGGRGGAVREEAPRQEQQQQQQQQLYDLPPPLFSPEPPPSTSSGAKPRLQSFLEEFRDLQKRGAGSDDDDYNRSARNPNLQDQASSRYLSGQFWANLCGEVEGLRQVLEHSTDTEEEEEEPVNPSEGATPESAIAAHDLPISAGLLPGYSALGAGGGRHHLAPAQHPPPDHVRYLTGVYFDNFDVIVKLLHRPTMADTLHRFADALEAASASAMGDYSQQDHPHLHPHPEQNNMPTPEQEALFFAIYYAAVTTLQPEACTAHLGRERAGLVHTFQAGLEHSLARADYLNSASLETLQALTIYVACLRCHSGSRASWALLSLPVRLAQALNLHREGRWGKLDSGSGSGSYTPYEVELRRRLWWVLIVLDIRGVEDRGTEPIVARGSYDTRLPLNVDDADFGPDTSPAEMQLAAEAREGKPTDMTFNLCTAQTSGLFLYLNYVAAGRGSGSVTGGGGGGPGSGGGDVADNTAADADAQPPSEEETIAHAQHLESQFVAGAANIDPARHVGAYCASFTVRLIILKLWLATQYPTHRRRERKRCPKEEKQRQLAAAKTTTAAAASADEVNAAGGGDRSSNNHNHNNDNSEQPRVTMTRTTITIHQRPKPTPPQTPTGTTDPCPDAGTGTGTGNCPNKLSSGVSREATLRTAVSIMELSHWASSKGPFASRLGWWSATYVQWHPLAVALAELCAQTRGSLVDRAWRVVDEVFPLWAERIADTKRGTLWRPIRKLHRKAKAARRAALGLDRGSGTGTGAGAQQSGVAGANASSIQARGPSGPSYIFPNTNDDDVPSVYDKTTMPHPTPENIAAVPTVPMILPDLMGAADPGGNTTALPPGLSTTTTTNNTPWINDESTTQAQQQPIAATAAAAPDLSSSSRPGISAGWFGDSMAWPDVSFDLPMAGAVSTAEWETMDWSAWDEFINDTHAEGPWTSPSDGTQ